LGALQALSCEDPSPWASTFDLGTQGEEKG
jgi:hypothetical protein